VLDQKRFFKDVLKFEQLPFNTPLFIMYSSGTTGKPKCIVHGAGGTLMKHLEEHQIQVTKQNTLISLKVALFFKLCVSGKPWI